MISGMFSTFHLDLTRNTSIYTSDEIYKTQKCTSIKYHLTIFPVPSLRKKEIQQISYHHVPLIFHRCDVLFWLPARLNTTSFIHFSWVLPCLTLEEPQASNQAIEALPIARHRLSHFLSETRLSYRM